MASPTDIGTVNARRLESPGSDTWERGVRRNSADRYLVITVDSHANEPVDVYAQGGLDKRYLHRVPHQITDDEGRQLLVVEGWDKPQLVMGRRKNTDYEAEYERDELGSSAQMWSERMEPDDLARMKASSTKYADEPTLTRLSEDMAADGVEGAIIFANRGQLCFATNDEEFLAAATHAWNIWAWDTYGAHNDRFSPAAQLATANIDDALRELDWIASTGFRAINIPCKAIFGNDTASDIPYNHPRFDPLWAAIADSGLAMCMHVATGRDPRAASGSGGAIINKAVGFLQGTMQPLAELLASGVFERHPTLRMVTVEADIGWIPWFLDALDAAYYKHHMWVRPEFDFPPSHYWHSNCSASFIEDPVGLYLASRFELIDNIMWSNDYPHHEGTWPHSPEAMERQLQDFNEVDRAKILGLNAARVFGFDIDKLRTGRS